MQLIAALSFINESMNRNKKWTFGKAKSPPFASSIARGRRMQQQGEGGLLPQTFSKITY